MAKALSAALLILFTIGPGFVYSQTPDKYYLLKAGQFYDSEKNVFVQDQQVLIKNNLVLEVGTQLTVPPDTEVLDLGDATIAPGLIDAHSHVLLEQQSDEPLAVDAMLMSSEARVLRAAKFSRSYLDAGFTTIRDLGNSGQYLDLEVRRAINRGYFPGPRMLVSGPIIGSMDGQVDGIPLADFDRISRQEYSMVSGVEEAKKAVREHIARGVDVIKILAIGNRLVLSLDEMKAIVETAHAERLTVTAHCDRDWAAQNAIEAGVDGIEHAYGFKPSTLEKMAAKGIYVVPTYGSTETIRAYYEVQNQPYTEQDLKDNAAGWNKWTRELKAADVTIVAGSDAYIDLKRPRGELAKQTIWGYADAGLSPEDVLQTATINAAAALGMKDQIGVIKPGAFADIVVFGGDLKTDIKTSLYQVKMVIKDGEIVFRK
ncbi:amidohydrolase family protein [Algoriphagus terrigena]|uniref:amidohydrolase family protein n=1 Tax=Algoriphagus terrigena TaxID=344884 RepID=UPI000419B842|nr:amidohydrolase family protein [Algoriphagus terrigena]